MERFRADGHLTADALRALVGGGDLDELARLELAEHLAFCDECLQRYTEALAPDTLLAPAHSCRESLRRRIRARAARLFANRYATAAAAVALALTMVWGGVQIPAVPAEDSLVQKTGAAMTRWAITWPETLENAFSNFQGFFDNFGGGPAAQGGTHS